MIKYQERLHRLGPLAELAINDVTAEQVADWQTCLMTTPRPDRRILSATTVADTRTTVRQLFNAAVDLGLIAPTRSTESSRRESPGQPAGCWLRKRLPA